MMVKMFILLYSRSMMIARGVLARLMYPPRSVMSGSVRRRLRKYECHVIATAYIPNSRPSKEQKKHDDNKNKIHIFLQNIWRAISLLHMWVQNDHSPASDSTYCS